jgi:large subunit ribosomal protein L25
MPEITLAAETGRPTGKRPARRLRAEGKVPAVLYGHGMAPISLAVDRRELRHALTGAAGVNAVVQLEVDGTTHATVVKELQRDPVRRMVTHVDFIVVRMDEKITVDVPVVLEGEAKQVQSEGGVIELALPTLAVVTTPRDIPPHITVDVSGLAIGDVVRVGDVALPAGVTAAVDADTPVVVAAGMAPEEVTPEGEEGEEAEGAEGAAGEGGGAGDTGE